MCYYLYSTTLSVGSLFFVDTKEKMKKPRLTTTMVLAKDGHDE